MALSNNAAQFTPGVGETDLALSAPAGRPLPLNTGYLPPNQPQTTPRGGTPAYEVPADQYNPLQVRPINNPRDIGIVEKELWKQTIPTSVNIRNRGLMELVNRMGTPMESLYAGKMVDDAASAFGQQRGGLASAMARRGLGQSGIQDAGMRSLDAGYMGAVGDATQKARGLEDARQLSNIQQLLGTAESDLGFYGAIRSGTIPAGNLFQTNTQWMQQLGSGLQELTKTLVGAGMGAAGGGGGMGIGGGGGGGGSMGAGGMSTYGSGGMFGGGGMSAYGNQMFMQGMNYESPYSTAPAFY